MASSGQEIPPPFAPGCLNGGLNRAGDDDEGKFCCTELSSSTQRQKEGKRERQCQGDDEVTETETVWNNEQPQKGIHHWKNEEMRE